MHIWNPTKKVIVLIGGWHYPYGFYEQISKLKIPPSTTLSVHVVSHRNINSKIVYSEKIDYMKKNNTNVFNKYLYKKRLTKKLLLEWGFDYSEYPNTIGDYNFIRQYLTTHPSLPDYLFFFHDDLYIKNLNIISDIVTNSIDSYYVLGADGIEKVKDDKWIHIANGFDNMQFNPRGSFAVFKKKLLKQRKHYLNYDSIKLSREDSNNSPDPDNLSELSEWNLVTQIFSKYIEKKGLQAKCYRLSPEYKESNYILECERGFVKAKNKYKN